MKKYIFFGLLLPFVSMAADDLGPCAKSIEEISLIRFTRQGNKNPFSIVDRQIVGPQKPSKSKENADISSEYLYKAAFKDVDTTLATNMVDVKGSNRKILTVTTKYNLKDLEKFINKNKMKAYQNKKDVLVTSGFQDTYVIENGVCKISEIAALKGPLKQPTKYKVETYEKTLYSEAACNNYSSFEEREKKYLGRIHSDLVPIEITSEYKNGVAVMCQFLSAGGNSGLALTDALVGQGHIFAEAESYGAAAGAGAPTPKPAPSAK
ncbi:MAG: hypothetical protein ACOYOK_04595 [Pseudobdellovibrionaceae bacterium]